MVTRKIFIYFLIDTPTGRVYYRDRAGLIQITIITSGTTVDVSLKNAPSNWMQTELGFIRNETYYGVNRTYTTPQEFVLDAKDMIQELFLLGLGTEAALTLAVFKYNSTPQAGEPNFELYYKGNLDLKKISSTVLEKLVVNLMDGGVTQLLKSYENTALEIPCDGSLIENIKVNIDGILVKDRFFYQFVELLPNTLSTSVLPCVYINNEGDNFGIVHNDPVQEEIPFYPAINTANYIFYSTSAITVKVKGYVILRGVGSPITETCLTSFQLLTNKGQLVFFNDYPHEYRTRETTTVRHDFEVSINLVANEKLYIVCQQTFRQVAIIAGSFNLEFASQYTATRAWGITAYDLFRLAVKEICRIASTTSQTFDFPATSNLLQQYLNFVVTSGDALRASGDPSYQRFYFIGLNNQISFGPVIKITLKEIYESLSVFLCAALGTGHNGTTETLYFEDLENAFDSSAISFSLGEVAKLKWKFSEKYPFSDIYIGTDPQTYDQKAGKYEYNTLLKMRAPVNWNEPKILEKKSKIRVDSYGVEKLRSNIGDATSTTRNDSDSSVFMLNVDVDQWIYDYFRAYFVSLVEDSTSILNTNIHFIAGYSNQVLSLPLIDGEYFQNNQDQAIFVFSVFGYSATESCNLTIDGIINSVNAVPGGPADFVNIKIWRNGVVLYSNTTTVSGVNTPITINHNFSQLFAYNDVLYITVETSITGEVNINTADLSIGTYVSMAGVNIPVLPGISQKLLSFGTIVNSVLNATKYGYQYFVFNSVVANTNFDLDIGIRGYMQGAATSFTVSIYVNGVIQPNNIILNGTIPKSFFVTTLSSVLNRNYALNDIVFITCTPAAGLSVSLQSANLFITSTYIKAYSLKRVQYDNLLGIPNIATDDNGNIRSDVPGAPYNIEDLTPKTCYKKWQNYIMSCFLDQVTGDMAFQTLSKNQYLSRTVGGVTITENSAEPILGFQRLFYPIEVEFETDVPITFAKLLSSSVNAHVHFTFMGNDLYFFPLDVKQKPALNDSQIWKGILSPVTNLSTFANITAFKLPAMGPNSIFCSSSSSVQFVPAVRVLNALYHTYNRDEFLFAEQVGRWFEKTGYCQPVQIGDEITLQFITRDLDPVSYTVYKADGTIYLGPNNLDTITSPAINVPYTLWQKFIDTTTWPSDDYYFIINAGVGSPAAQLISECLHVRPSDEMEDTTLIEFVHSSNTQGLVFDGNIAFRGKMRIQGMFDNLFKQKYKGAFFIDQPQDIKILNAIPYETTSLIIFGQGGVPNYVAKKVLRMLLMDGTTLDGEGFTLNEGAEIEEVFTKGAPKKIQKIEIRPSANKQGISVNASGLDEDNSLIVTITPGSMGPNVTNQSGTTDPDLIDIVITN